MTKNNINSLYIHIPFCESICDYCDFTKLQYFRNIASTYLEALEKELTETVTNHDLLTIYIGGGTPTSLEDDLFLKLLQIVDPYSKKAKEYTIEANPESLSVNKIKMMKEYGVNRVSIGVESTDDRILKDINRHHTFSDVKKAKELLELNGINNINFDLMLGLPNVSIKMLQKDILNILSLNPTHVSCYSLTVHEHTVFHINKITPPSDEFSYEAYRIVDSLLKKEGFIHYEVSNWCKPNKESLHNLTYWRNEPYYGVGLGASGYVNDVRYKNTTNLSMYLKGTNAQEKEVVKLKDLEIYQIMLNLRTIEGLDLEKYHRLFKKDLYKEKQQIIDGYIDSGHLKIVKNHLIPTFEGMMILDKITLDLIA